MWPFATRGSRFLGDASDHHPSQLNPNDFARNDAVIKLWLPGRLLAAVDVLCDRHDASRDGFVIDIEGTMLGSRCTAIMPKCRVTQEIG